MRLSPLLFFTLFSSLLFTSLHFTSVHSPHEKCSTNPNKLKCCDESVGTTNVKCFFMTIEQRLKDKDCNCGFSYEGHYEFAHWGDKLLVHEGGSVPGDLSQEKCSKSITKLEGPMRCLPYHPNYLIPYPPRMIAINYDKELFCEDTISIYKRMLTCSLYDCEDRLRIPERNKTCFPPILYEGSHLKYCTRYTVSEGPFFTNEDYKTMDSSKCVLPPLCGNDDYDNGINKTIFMIPLIKGEPDEAYCEKLCPKSANSGEYHGGKCRRRHSCSGNNLYQIPQSECLPWCKDDDSYSKVSTYDNCNPRPRCDPETNKTPPKYSADNPFGAEDCVETPYCGPEYPEDKYDCLPSFFVRHATAIGIVCGVTILLILIAVCVGVICCIRRRRAQSSEDDEEEEEENQGEQSTVVGRKKGTNVVVKDENETVEPIRKGKKGKEDQSGKPKKKKKVNSDDVSRSHQSGKSKKRKGDASEKSSKKGSKKKTKKPSQENSD